MAKRLIPPKDGATVRFYRTGHGDCFLLAFAGTTQSKPAYVLIDCGYKPGSPAHLEPAATVKDITRSIGEATGGHIDVMVVTHEHQDHVNGITATHFKNLTIGETWLAWTEDGTDDLANQLRTEFKDKLFGLIAARHRLAALGDKDRTRRIDRFLAFELGGEEENLVLPPLPSLMGAMTFGHNKRSLLLARQKAQNGVRTIRPHEEILEVPGAKDLRVYALGPPRSDTRLRELDPQGEEAFHLAAGATSAGTYFAAAAASPAMHGESPFASRFRVALDAAPKDPDHGKFFTDHYGTAPTAATESATRAAPATGGPRPEVADDAPWRRIDNDWLFAADQLALDIGDYVNNTSLVLAFELGKGGKVLFFAADAQRGNWVSWDSKTWSDGDEEVTARDLLARTVLYKVGHHGSHNATLDGTPDDEWPNLSWMATRSKYAREFTAMITAVRSWAEEQDGWDHPLQSIKDALIAKAGGRVFQTDTDFSAMQKPPDASDADWERFQERASGERLFFDLKIKR